MPSIRVMIARRSWSRFPRGGGPGRSLEPGQERRRAAQNLVLLPSVSCGRPPATGRPRTRYPPPVPSAPAPSCSTPCPLSRSGPGRDGWQHPRQQEPRIPADHRQHRRPLGVPGPRWHLRRRGHRSNAPAHQSDRQSRHPDRRCEQTDAAPAPALSAPSAVGSIRSAHRSPSSAYPARSPATAGSAGRLPQAPRAVDC
jgi:hypothetical protein